MDFTALVARVDAKTFGPKNTSNLTADQKAAYVNLGYNDLYLILTEKDLVAAAYFATHDEALSPTTGEYYLPTTCFRLLGVVNAAKDTPFVQKNEINRTWTQITTEIPYITYIKSREVLAASGAGTVTTPYIDPAYHEIIADFAAYEYFSELGLAYQAEAKKWLDIANTKAYSAAKQLYWNVITKKNENYNPDTSNDTGYYFIDWGYDATTGKRKIRLYHD